MKLKLLFNSHYWFDVKYKIKSFFYPQQEWLTDLIPNTYCDKTELIPRILFACLVDYVEVELDSEHHHSLGYDFKEELKKGWVSKEYAELHMKKDAKLLKAYNYIKTGRDHIEARIDAAYPPRQDWEDMFKKSKEKEGYYEMTISEERSACYKEVNRLEAIKLDKDKWCMRVIIRYHEYLWT
mgnify:FL=1